MHIKCFLLYYVDIHIFIYLFVCLYTLLDRVFGPKYCSNNIFVCVPVVYHVSVHKLITFSLNLNIN